MRSREANNKKTAAVDQTSARTATVVLEINWFPRWNV